MLKLAKLSVIIVLGLMLTLSLFTSGASAHQIQANQTAITTHANWGGWGGWGGWGDFDDCCCCCGC